MSSVLLKAVVGSRLHGLANDESDYDYITVVVDDLKAVLSPFRDSPASQVQTENSDTTTFELRKFLKLAVAGNPTVLEALWSDQIEELSLAGARLIQNRKKLLATVAVYKAHVGYGSAQSRQVLTDPGMSEKRRGKYAAAAIRVYQQGLSLLLTDTFDPVAPEEYRDLLLKLKRGVDYPTFIIDALPVIEKLKRLIDFTYLNMPLQASHQADIEWIEDFILRTYMEIMETGYL